MRILSYAAFLGLLSLAVPACSASPAGVEPTSSVDRSKTIDSLSASDVQALCKSTLASATIFTADDALKSQCNITGALSTSDDTTSTNLETECTTVSKACLANPPSGIVAPTPQTIDGCVAAVTKDARTCSGKGVSLGEATDCNEEDMARAKAKTSPTFCSTITMGTTAASLSAPGPKCLAVAAKCPSLYRPTQAAQ